VFHDSALYYYNGEMRYGTVEIEMELLYNIGLLQRKYLNFFAKIMFLRWH
jgi:hypothetical protein